MAVVLDCLEGGSGDPRVDQDRHGEILGHHTVRRRERLVVEVAESVVGPVVLDESLDILECPIELSGSDNKFHTGIVSGPGDALAGAHLCRVAHLASCRSPRFLPAARRHGSAPFRAFVQVEGTRQDRAVASGRQAGRQRSSDRGIASEPDGWRRIRSHRRGSGPRL